MELLENLLIGVVSGAISSLAITQFYREIDKKQNRYDYIIELLQYATELSKVLSNNNIDKDEYISNVNQFFINNPLPIRKKWVRLKKNEMDVCKGFINFYDTVFNELLELEIHMEKMRKDKDTDVFEEHEVNMIRTKLSTMYYLQSINQCKYLFDIRAKYAE